MIAVLLLLSYHDYMAAECVENRSGIHCLSAAVATLGLHNGFPLESWRTKPPNGDRVYFVRKALENLNIHCQVNRYEPDDLEPLAKAVYYGRGAVVGLKEGHAVTVVGVSENSVYWIDPDWRDGKPRVDKMSHADFSRRWSGLVVTLHK